MANIWWMELEIDGALQNLMLYVSQLDDVIQRESKEKTESLQYLRGQ